MKDRSVRLVAGYSEGATMGLDDRARNVKSHAGSRGLRRNEWLEDTAAVLTLYAYA